MDRVNRKIKGFRGVLDGLRSSVTAPPRADTIEETLKSDYFQLAKTVRHGFPHQPTAMAWDSVQHLLAIGTKTGSVRVFGRPGVDCHIKHEGEIAVIQVMFLVNEGAMITACADETLHLWNLRQKKPEIVHSLKFQRERITCCHLPFQSKWLYVGSERGNVHIVNIESFVLSGYIINWNKAIELSRKTHPGPVVHLSSNPQDPNKLLIGFEAGLISLWDLKSKTADVRLNCPETLKSVSWHQDGKQLMASHGDGSITVWNLKTPAKPQSILMPHAKLNSDGKPEPCRAIHKVEWKCVKTGEPYIIFSGGKPYERAMRSPSLTVMHGKSTTVLEMEHTVIDFIPLCSTPWNNDLQDVYGIVVLLQNDLVVIDLTTPGFPCFENPYPMDIHEAPVTSCKYVADCPPDIIPALYQVGFKQKKTGFSEKEWPVKGGEWGTTTCSYPEIIISGHADGSLKFWDASAATLQVLYKLKTNRLFDKNKCKSPDPDDDPFAIQHIFFCAESKLLLVAGVTHVLVFKFCKQETSAECSVVETAIVYEIYDETDSPETEYPPSKPSIGSVSQQSGSVGSYSSTCSDPLPKSDSQTSVRVKSGSKKWSAGYVPELCCVLQWLDGEPPPPITSISLHAKFGLMAFGNECGIAIVDLVQKCCLLNMGTPDLYGGTELRSIAEDSESSMDPYSRAPRSPKNKNTTSQPSSINSGVNNACNDDSKSPTSEQSHTSSTSRAIPEHRIQHKHNRPHTTYALAKINESGTESEPNEHPEFKPSSVDDSHLMHYHDYVDDDLGFRSLCEPMIRKMNGHRSNALVQTKPSAAPVPERKSEIVPPEKTEKKKNTVPEKTSDSVVFELMPSAAARRKLEQEERCTSMLTPDMERTFDFVPDAYDICESVNVIGGRKIPPSRPPPPRPPPPKHAPQPAQHGFGARLEDLDIILAPTSQKNSSKSNSSQSSDKDSEKSSKSHIDKKRKKSFFSKFLDKSDKNETSSQQENKYTDLKINTCSIDTNDEDSTDVEVGQEADECSSTPTSPRAPLEFTLPPPGHPSACALRQTSVPALSHADEAEEIRYLESAAAGLRKGSKSDFDLAMRSLPLGTQADGLSGGSKSSQQLNQTCDVGMLKSSSHKQSQPQNQPQQQAQQSTQQTTSQSSQQLQKQFSSHTQSSVDSANSTNSHSTTVDTSATDANQSEATPITPCNTLSPTSPAFPLPEDDNTDGYIDRLLLELEKQKKDNAKESFVRKLSRKVKSIGSKSNPDTCMSLPNPIILDDEVCVSGAGLLDARKKRPTNQREEEKFSVIDMSDDDVGEKPPIKKLTYTMLLSDGGSFSRSRSSSMSSLENISKEAIQCLNFAESYTHKTDNCTCPCLWVGTSLGSVLVIKLQLPNEQDRKREPVVVSPSGTIFRLKGAILCMSFMDCNGILQGVSCNAEQTTDSPTKDKRSSQYFRQQSSASLVSNMSNSSTEQPVDRQFAIICSERHARVVSLPSQTVVHKHKVTDTSIVTVADVITIRNTVSLVCYVANGHIITFSLPSLRPMLDADFLPLTDLSHICIPGVAEKSPVTEWETDLMERIAKTFQFSNNGHAMYFCSPSEIQKLTLSSEICDSLDEMLGELFIPCDTPEAPKKTFLQNIFSGGSSTLDREELFGDASGKASRGVAKYSAGNAGMAQTQERAANATSEIGRAKLLALERGQKLGQLTDTTEQMRTDAEEYAKTAHMLANKFKNKKWYQF